MQITLNEYSLAFICGGISCLTYLLTASFAKDSKTVRIKDSGKTRTRKTILKSNNSDMNESVDEDEPEDDTEHEEQMSASERFQNRRQSYNRSKPRRSDSIVKSDHVIFADEITADDEKFSPAHDEIPDDMVEGILSRSEEEAPLSVNFNITEVEELNHFDEIHPLDDHDLMMRRRSLHSTPSGSHRGSKTNLAHDLDHGDEANDQDSHAKSQLRSYKERIADLESEIADMEHESAKEKYDLEKVIEDAGLDSGDLATSVQELHILLQSALKQLRPDWPKDVTNSKLLDRYIEKHLNGNL